MDPFFNIVSEHYQVPFRNELSNKYLFRFCYLTDDRCKELSDWSKFCTCPMNRRVTETDGNEHACLAWRFEYLSGDFE